MGYDVEEQYGNDELHLSSVTDDIRILGGQGLVLGAKITRAGHDRPRKLPKKGMKQVICLASLA